MMKKGNSSYLVVKASFFVMAIAMIGHAVPPWAEAGDITILSAQIETLHWIIVGLSLLVIVGTGFGALIAYRLNIRK